MHASQKVLEGGQETSEPWLQYIDFHILLDVIGLDDTGKVDVDIFFYSGESIDDSYEWQQMFAHLLPRSTT